MKLIQTLKSCLDASVNFIFDNAMEARFVQRTPDYFICYVSSHDGCNKACRFCHLTQTKQTSFNPASIDNYKLQVQTVLNYYMSLISNGQEKANRLNVNFMARGEPLANEELIKHLPEFSKWVSSEAQKLGLSVSLNLSSIIPKDCDLPSIEAALQQCADSVVLYYSLYSVKDSFRKRWLPNALPAHQALTWLASMQQKFGLKVVLHWAFIEAENDSVADVNDLANQVKEVGLDARFNLVRYNPYSTQQGQEVGEEKLHDLFELVQAVMNVPGSRIVPKVGFDVKASCGMFVTV